MKILNFLELYHMHCFPFSLRFQNQENFGCFDSRDDNFPIKDNIYAILVEIVNLLLHKSLGLLEVIRPCILLLYT